MKRLLVAILAPVLVAQTPVIVTQGGNQATVSAGGAVKVDGSAVTQPISAVSLPLPSTAATSTKQSDGTQKTQIVDGAGNVIGATTNALDINIKSGNPTTITATQATGTNLHTVVDSGAVTATLGAGTAAIGKLTANTGVTIGAVEIAASQTLSTVTTVGAVTSITNALPAGTNGIGKLTANSGVDIGDVDPSTPASWAIAATAGAAPANAQFSGAVGKSAQPTAVSDGQLVGTLAALDGALYARPYGPIVWSCGVTNIAATLTQCQGVPGAGLSLYITDVVTQSNTSTAGLFTLRFGTGTNCGTGTGNLFFGSASALMASPANTAPVNHFHLTTPIKLTANNAVCVLGVATNTTNAQITGFTAP